MAISPTFDLSQAPPFDDRPRNLSAPDAAAESEQRPAELEAHASGRAAARAADEWLVNRLKAGDEDAARQVYRLYSDAIYRYALYQCGNATLAEDVTGEVFLRLLESIGSYTYRGAPISSWLYRIAHNLVVDHHRRSTRLKPLDDADEAKLISDNPVDVAEGRLSWAELRQTFRELTGEQRQVILLKFVENLDNREVAEITGRTEGSVKSLQHRALRKLKRILDHRAALGGGP